MKKEKKGLLFFSAICFICSFLCVVVYVIIKPFFQYNLMDNVKLISNDENELVLKVNANGATSCGYGTNDYDVEWVDSVSDVCIISANSNLSDIYLKKYFFTKKYKIDNLVVNDNLPKKIYLAVNDSYKLNPELKIIGDRKSIVYNSLDDSVVNVVDNKVIAKKIGKAKVTMTVNDNYEKDMTVIVTGLLVKRPEKFNNDKPYLTCGRYTTKQAKMIDMMLANRIKNVGGYKTRAAVVEAIRFLLLDFPYQIDYFYENGRLITGNNYADGEGRYYHVGLYLSEDKFNSLESIKYGPATWGCPLRNWEDDPPKYKKGGYNANGLDCSGFVSWAIRNGGYDPGDRPAGDNLKDTTELNDIGGEKVKITDSFVNSGRLKAGDIVGIWGHIAIVAGIDDENVYVAESLWTYGGVVINTYKKNELDNKFVQAVLLDDYYEKDGLYTDMW